MPQARVLNIMPAKLPKIKIKLLLGLTGIEMAMAC
jgi:hypothetical protein